MTGYTIPPIIVSISIVALFLAFILFYLYRTSEFFSLRLLKKSLSFLLIIYFLILAIAAITIRAEDDFTRIAVMPGESDNDSQLLQRWTTAEIISVGLSNNMCDEFLVYPSHRLIEAVEMDSLDSIAYCKRFARATNLDYLILLKGNDNSAALSVHNFRTNSDTTIATNDYAAQISQLLNALNSKLAGPAVAGSDTLLAKANISISLLKSSRKYDKAVELAGQLYLLDSTNVAYRNLLAETQLTAANYYDYQGKPSGLLKMAALRVSERTITNYDDANATAYRLLGEYYVLEKMWGKAEYFLFRSYELNPHDPETLLVLSHLHSSRTAKLGYKDREALLRRAIQLDPCFERARIELADHLYFNKWPGRAKREIEKLLAIHPNSIEGWLYLGKLAVGESKIDQIVAIYNKILEIDPENAEAFYNLGVHYYNSGDVANAIRFFKKAIEYGDHLDSHLYLGHIYNQQGEKDKAIAEYRYRVKYKRGLDDPYADEARKHLYHLTNADSALDAFYGRNK